VVTHEGNLFVWGNKLSHVPAMVNRDALGGMKIVDAGLGGSNSAAIALLAEDGSLWTLGMKKSNMLGIAKAPGRLTEPGKVEGGWLGRVKAIVAGPGTHIGCIAEME
jgi:hypothetical protein